MPVQTDCECRVCGGNVVRLDTYPDHGSVIENYRCEGRCHGGGYATLSPDGSRRYGGPIFTRTDLSARYAMQGTLDVAADGGEQA